MLWERDLMSWKRDKYFFTHVPSVLPYKCADLEKSCRGGGGPTLTYYYFMYFFS